MKRGPGHIVLFVVVRGALFQEGHVAQGEAARWPKAKLRAVRYPFRDRWT